MSKPSDHFIRAFCHSGSVCKECEFCGRTHFDSNGEFMEDGELEKYLLLEKEHPEKWVGMPGSVSWGTIAGKDFVEGCECLENSLSKYEDFIWHHRYAILQYFSNRSKKELADATELKNKIDSSGIK